jgi:hypothetical protein
MVGMAVATTVDSIEARNKLNITPMVMRMILFLDIAAFQNGECSRNHTPKEKRLTLANLWRFLT